jgi:hypothetical protein
MASPNTTINASASDGVGAIRIDIAAGSVYLATMSWGQSTSVARQTPRSGLFRRAQPTLGAGRTIRFW